MKNARNFPSRPLIDIYGLIVKHRLPFDNYATTTCRSVCYESSSPTPKVTLHGWIVIERRRRARLRRRLLLTPWQRGLVKRMFHGKKISPSLIIPDCILPRSQREREKHEERNGNTEAEGSRGEGECREEG